MPDKLPKGWVKTTLGAIVKPSRDRILPIEVPTMKYVGLEHIEPQTMSLLGTGHGHDVRSSSVMFRQGDVLYGKMRPYLNKVWVAEFDGICSAEFLVFPKRDGLNNHFLALRMNGEDFVAFANSKVNGERPRVDFGALSSFPILLPPITEQERIVTKLMASLSGIQRAEMISRRAQKRFFRYRDAVIHAAVTGELTREWREANKPNESGGQLLSRLLEDRRARWHEVNSHRFRVTGKKSLDSRRKSHYAEPMPPGSKTNAEIPRDWAWATVEQINSGDRPSAYGVLQPGPDVPNGVPLVRVGDINNGKVQIDNLKHIAPRIADGYGRTKLRGGELLITLVGTIGRTAIAPPSLKGANTARAVGVVPLSPLLNASWVELWFRSPAQIDEMVGKAHEVARKTLNLQDVRSAHVPLPPLVEQAEIVREVERRFIAANRLSLAVEASLRRAMELRQSLLRDAFGGRLVPQDSTDKPASELLVRLDAAREAEAKQPRPKHMSKSKPKPARRPLLEVLREHKKPITPEQLFREAGFQPAQADLFYRELTSLRQVIMEKKPSASQAKAWPHRAHVLLELKEV